MMGEDYESQVPTMKLTVTTLGGDMYNFEVSDDMELENFKAFCELESGVSAAHFTLMWNGIEMLDDKMSLSAYGIHDGDVVLLKQTMAPPGPQARPGSAPAQSNVPRIDFGSMRMPGMPGATTLRSPTRPTPQQLEDPNVVRELLLSRPHDMSIIKERNPELADALLKGTKEKFAEVFRRQQGERLATEKKRLEMLKRDQFDPEVQRMIAEEIRLKNVDTNMETAMEYSPESFGQVVMLYIDCLVNGHHVKAFVDSGAQMTIMSSECAERCHIKHLIDTRWAGVAHGVGTQKILGRVHLGQIQIGETHLQSSFSILEHQPMDMLLGLDMLRRHQCSIDLKNNKLVIGTSNTETPFLPESELPANIRAGPSLPGNRSSMETDDHNLAQALAKSADESTGTPAASTSHNPPGATSHNASAETSAEFPESSISTLVSYGYSREKVIEQLRLSKGSIDQALAALIAKSIPSFPPT